jgi:hypothetical protein
VYGTSFKQTTRLLGILSEGAMKMNTFPKVNMVGMEKDCLQLPEV